MIKKVFAFRNNSEHLNSATSGGAFIALVEVFFSMFFEKEKRVYGVTFDENLNVHYEVAETIDDCLKFSGSKYVRSDCTGIFEKIKDDLIHNKAVLFTGTPCTVSALKKFLNVMNVNQEYLICVDLICHGAPQALYWKAYREWLENKYKSELIDFKFRTHGINKNGYACIAQFKNGKKIVNVPETQVYNRMFLRHYLFSKACFQCKYANTNRIGDITIGDFWGIESVMPDFPFKQDVSEILINTEKGETVAKLLLSFASSKEYCIELCFNDDFIKFQNNLQKPASEPIDFELFQEEFLSKGFEYVASKYVGYNWLHRLKYLITKKL